LALDGKISNAPYVFPLHEGHKEYDVYPVNKKALYWIDKVNAQMVKGIKGLKGKRKLTEVFSRHHIIPAAPGDPWLPRALEAKKSECIELLRDAMTKTITQAGF
jgi:hypothetical protein